MPGTTHKLASHAISAYTEKLRKWFDLLNEIMPGYFFQTFTSEEIHDILPALLNLRNDGNIQQIQMGNTVILLYCKSEQNNLVKTARMMKRFDIVGANIHESLTKVVVDGEPATLVIEYYKVGGTDFNIPPCHTKKEVTDAYRKLYKTAPAALSEIYDRINWNSVRDLDTERLAERLRPALLAQTEDRIFLDVHKVGKDELRLTMALSNCQARGFYCKYIECLARNGFQVQRAYLRKMTNQNNVEDFQHMPVSVNTLYLKSEKGSVSTDSPQVRKMLAELPHIKWVPFDDLLHRELMLARDWSMAETNLIRAAAEFIHTQLSFVDRHAYNGHDIFRLAVLYEPILKQFLRFFDQRCNPELKTNAAATAKLGTKIKAQIDRINTGSHEKDVIVKTVLHCMLNFIEHVQKTNYYSATKSVLSFRLDPSFMSYYAKQYPSYRQAFPNDRPFGIFYFFRDNGLGFHIRFSDIARGGWRTVIPASEGHHLERQDAYASAEDEIFREVFVLAHTQHLKNKDIYEGGAKMICLLQKPQEESGTRAKMFEVQRSICRAFLDLVDHDAKGKLKNPAVKDLYDRPEIIEIGPDENMFDAMIGWIGEYAEKVNYRLGGGLISGKPDTGINHKHYGVTSFGVHQYLLKTLSELGLDPAKDEFSLKLAGGPFGDVAGNELKLLLARNGRKRQFPNLKIIAVTDGPAAVYDPDGMDQDELENLIHSANLDSFRPEKLKGDGAFMIFSKPLTENDTEYYRLAIRKNKTLQEKMIGRDEFMRIFQGNLLSHYADIFLPCGGRPATINDSNWESYLLPDGRPSSKAIIEGANSFLTPEARNRLQERGLWIIKDASANKCGVITSSYEILIGLMLNREEFKELRDVLIPQVMEILRCRAVQEAEWLFALHRKTGKPMTSLTEQLSVEINAKNAEIRKYLHTNPGLISPELILAHLPPLFSERFRDRLERIPLEYQEAIAGVELAVRIVYGKTNRIEDEINTVMGQLQPQDKA